jgi:hypothetical protein
VCRTLPERGPSSFRASSHTWRGRRTGGRQGLKFPEIEAPSAPSGEQPSVKK